MKYAIALVLSMSAAVMLLAQTGIAKAPPRLTDTIRLSEVEIVSYKIAWTFVDPPFGTPVISEELITADTTKVCNRKCKKCIRLQKREARKQKH